MIRTARLLTIAMVAAAAITFGAGAALAHTVTIQNCIGERQAFYAYNQDDAIMFTSASGTGIEEGESGTLHCEGSQYCKVRAIDAQSPHQRVDEAITFYSRTEVNKFIDADCSHAP